jgi:quercetin dioxygenase-like cupin family protein
MERFCSGFDRDPLWCHAVVDSSQVYGSQGLHILEGTVTFSIDGDVFNASVGSIVVIPAGAHHAWRNRSNAPIRMSTSFRQVE